MGKGYRADRLSEEIRKLVSQMLMFELKDPNLDGAMTSVSEVRVTSDGSYGTIFLSVLLLGMDLSKAGEEAKLKKEEEILQAMNKAKGKIRSRLAKEIKLRYTPELVFKIDKSQDYGKKMDEIIDRAVKTQDEE